MNALSKIKRFVVLVSGGMDSVTLLRDMHQREQAARTLSLDYNQRHRRELECAALQSAKIGVPHSTVFMPELSRLLPGSALTDRDVPVPHGHYAEESMKKTVVPNRNAILLSIAAAHALAHGLDGVAIAAHAGDHAIYPDCRLEFFGALQNAIREGNYNASGFEIRVPYIMMDKGDIAIVGRSIGVDYENTWTCYEGGSVPCGKCGACVERAEAFAKAGIPDPLLAA